MPERVGAAASWVGFFETVEDDMAVGIEAEREGLFDVSERLCAMIQKERKSATDV
jgi:hypothetical protein